MAKKSKTTKAQSGLSIKRNGEKFILSWKKGDTYAAQKLQFKIGGGKWKNVTIAKGATQKTITVDRDNYYPRKKKGKTVKSVQFRVKAKHANDSKTNYEWSAWKTKLYTINKPRKPSVSVTKDSELANVSKFAWSTVTDTTSSYFYSGFEYQTMRVDNSRVTNGEKLSWNSKTAKGWKSGTGDGSSSSITVTEDTVALAVGSSTRWLRVRSRGVRGASKWSYAHHVYATPNAARVVSASAKKGASDTFICSVAWEVSAPASKPIDKTTVQYSFAVPDVGLTYPDSGSWEDGNVSKDTEGSDAATFSIDGQLGTDQCLFVRVNTEHDGIVTYGIPSIVDGGKGRLSDPTELSVSTDTQTHRATITVENNSDIEDSFIAVVYRNATTPSEDFIIGVVTAIDNGEITVQCPDWGEDQVAFGAYAVVGDYEEQEREDGVSSYSITEQMRSANTLWYGGLVPLAPSNVRAVPVAGGTITVSWDWTWQEASVAELSWADHEDAWESTEEPDDYRVANLHASQWNISGLETGKTWYVRVRLIKIVNDAETAGPYSRIIPVDLSSAPAIPALQLYPSVITVNDSVTATWGYVTGDGTTQAYAEICEAEVLPTGVQYGVYRLSTDITTTTEDSEGNVEPNGKTYYEREGAGTAEEPYTYTAVEASQEDNPTENEWYEFIQSIAHTETAQTISINAADVGWNAGETHYLAVRVVSAAGRQSDGWSAPVPVTVAEPLVAEITETSLVEETLPVNPRSFTGDVVSFSSDVEEIFTKLKVEMEPIQDLHGYDKPWAAGANSNKWDEQWELGAFDTSTGTDILSTKQIRAKNRIPVSPSTTYYFVVSSYVWTIFYDGDGNVIPSAQLPSGTYHHSGNSLGIGEIYDSLVTTPSNCQYIRFYCQVGYGATYKNDIAINYPSTVTTYSPYENICPISGWDSVEANVTGVNVWDEEWELGTIATSSGADAGSTTQIRSKGYTSVKPDTSYYFTGYAWMLGYDSNKDIVQFHVTTTISNNASYVHGTFTTPPNCYYVRFYELAGYGTTYKNDLSINYPATDTEYHAYDGDTYTTTLPQTVYGGTVDLVSGVLTVDRAYVDLGALNWIYRSNLGGMSATLSPMAKDQFKAVCSIYPYGGEYYELADKQCGYVYDNQIFVKDNDYTDEAAFKTAMNGVQLVYELATPRTIQLDQQTITTLVGVNNVWADSGEVRVSIAEDMRQALCLKELPFTATVTGAGEGTTTLAIERAEEYHVDRPDETEFTGFNHETIALVSQTGEDEIQIDVEDLIGFLDDGAQYRIVATVQDELGQSDETDLLFEVHWEHQAVMPTASVRMENGVAVISAQKPSEWREGDVIDIYRLSVDRPELIVENGDFGVEYVDPYPTIGEFGGHRIVYKTLYGDYISEDNIPAWVDTDEDEGDYLDTDYSIIDFDGNRIELFYDVSVSNDWEKDFNETRYLGGAIAGDWNEGVGRSATVTTSMLSITDQETIALLRRLAVYTGLCHIRTLDGSSFACDIQVSESRDSSKYNQVANFSMSVTRVDAQDLDGMTYEMWSE